MMIETERLFLIPLTARRLRLWVEDMTALEKELNCSYHAEPVEGVFLEILRRQLFITEQDEENYLYHSFWFLVRKEDRIVVGSADFKDLPNADGEVEIGYGLGRAYEHNGYMTEAVKAMCQWALGQGRVSCVIAETETDGMASQRILERCGFQKYKEENTLWWRL